MNGQRILPHCPMTHGMSWPVLFLVYAGVTFADTHYVSPTGTHVPPYTNWVTAATNIQDATTVRSVIGPDFTFVVGSGPMGDTAVRYAYEFVSVADAVQRLIWLVNESNLLNKRPLSAILEEAEDQEPAVQLDVMSASRPAVRVPDANATYPRGSGPTFSDADWVSLNVAAPGSDGRVDAIAVDGSGTVYAGGEFTIIGAVRAKYIAKWDGSTWSSLGTGMNGFVYALAVDGTNLYAGGEFTTAGGVTVNHVARWNGTAWSPLGAGMNNSVYALVVNGTDVYAGGEFVGAGAVTAYRVAKWNGSAWSALGSGMDSYVGALAFSGTDLYAGGLFTTAGGGAANYIARWNGGAWSSVGSGVNGYVTALAANGTDLYVGGLFTTAGGRTADYVARWNGSAWSALGSGMNAGVRALAVSGSDLYAGGLFTTAGGGAAGYVARWNGSAWSPLGSGANYYVNALAADTADHVFVGGEFSLAGTKVSPYIAQANTGGPLLDHFTWDPIPSPNTMGLPFAVTLTASDLIGRTATSFTETVTLSGHYVGVISTNRTVGDGTEDWGFPMYTLYHDARTQVIYLSGELGGACTITSLALNVTTPPDPTMENWTIRVQHTALAEYSSSPEWEGSGWTVGYQADEPSGVAGWRTFEFSTPFEYNGTNNLLIDFSFNNSDYVEEGECRYTESAASRTIFYRTDSAFGDPLSWSGTNPSPSLTQNVPNIMLGVTGTGAIPVTISPTTSGPFVNGIWTGTVIVQDVVTQMVLRADDGAGHSGESAEFDTQANDLDTDGDGIHDDWELRYFPSLTNVSYNTDWDRDGFRDGFEFHADTIPTNASSYLGITSVTSDSAGTEAVIQWSSESNKQYSVFGTSNLTDGLDALLDEHILATPPENAFTDTLNGVDWRYYGVEVEVEP